MMILTARQLDKQGFQGSFQNNDFIMSENFNFGIEAWKEILIV